MLEIELGFEIVQNSVVVAELVDFAGIVRNFVVDFESPVGTAVADSVNTNLINDSVIKLND